MTHSIRTRAFSWLLTAMLFATFAAVDAPTAEAQRSSLSRRDRRARIRARHARARRARRRAELAENTPAAPAESVDMDFTSHFDAETPPPMDTSYVEEVEAQQLEERRAMLDPELFGEAAGATPSAPSGPAERGRYSPLTARIAARVFHRGLGYRDFESGAVANYDLPLGAAALVAVDYYPLAHILNDAWAHIGFSWSFVHSIAVESIGPNNIGYPTNMYAWNVGLRYRVPLDESGGEIAFEAGYGEQGFHVERGDLNNPPPPGVPAVDYDIFRLAVAGRFTFGQAAFGGRIGYLPAIGSGAIASSTYFGGADVHGVEAGLEFDYALGLGFEILAEVDMRLFVLDFHETASGGARAGGAFDRYIGGNVGLRWRMPAHSQL